VCGIKFHLTFALFESVVLSCPSEEVYTGFCWRKLRERANLGDLGVDGSIILRCIFR